MTNIEKYNKTFIDFFKIEEKYLFDLKYQSITAWDSIGHMGLIAELEMAFDIMMDTDDVIELSSYNKGKEILTKSFNIEF